MCSNTAKAVRDLVAAAVREGVVKADEIKEAAESARPRVVGMELVLPSRVALWDTRYPKEREYVTFDGKELKARVNARFWMLADQALKARVLEALGVKGALPGPYRKEAKAAIPTTAVTEQDVARWMKARRIAVETQAVRRAPLCW